MDNGAEHTRLLIAAIVPTPTHVVAATTPDGGILPSTLATGIAACRQWPDVGAIAIAATWPTRPVDTEAVEAAIASAAAPVYISAGNRGVVEWPATAPGAIAVGAVDDTGATCAMSADVPVVALGCGSDQPAWGTSIAVAEAAAAAL